VRIPIRPRQEGFTLIELILTASILAIASVSMVTLFISAEALNRQARNLTVAGQLAHEKLESQRNTLYNGLTVGTSNFTSSLPSSLTAPRSGTVTITEVEPDGLKQVDVLISWTDGGKTKRVQSSTLIAKRGINR
jgi:prepilin-type N-terminal cleavage/methylation domain-containing protein